MPWRAAAPAPPLRRRRCARACQPAHPRASRCHCQLTCAQVCSRLTGGRLNAAPDARSADAGALSVSAWFVYDAPGAALFPAGDAVRDVLHLAAPGADGEQAPQMHTQMLRLRVPPGCVSARDVLAHVAGAASVAPVRDGAGARAVAALPGGGTLRASAARGGSAELAIAMPHAPASRTAAVAPLVRDCVLLSSYLRDADCAVLSPAGSGGVAATRAPTDAHGDAARWHHRRRHADGAARATLPHHRVPGTCTLRSSGAWFVPA